MRLNVYSGTVFHKMTGQSSQTLKPLHVLEDLRQLPESVNMEVRANWFFE